MVLDAFIQQYACDVEAEVIGKPSTMFFQSVLNDMGIQPHEVIRNMLPLGQVLCVLFIVYWWDNVWQSHIFIIAIIYFTILTYLFYFYL